MAFPPVFCKSLCWTQLFYHYLFTFQTVIRVLNCSIPTRAGLKQSSGPGMLQHGPPPWSCTLLGMAIPRSSPLLEWQRLWHSPPPPPSFWEQQEGHQAPLLLTGQGAGGRPYSLTQQQAYIYLGMFATSCHIQNCLSCWQGSPEQQGLQLTLLKCRRQFALLWESLSGSLQIQVDITTSWVLS